MWKDGALLSPLLFSHKNQSISVTVALCRFTVTIGETLPVFQLHYISSNHMWNSWNFETFLPPHRYCHPIISTSKLSSKNACEPELYQRSFVTELRPPLQEGLVRPFWSAPEFDFCVHSYPNTLHSPRTRFGHTKHCICETALGVSTVLFQFLQ